MLNRRRNISDVLKINKYLNKMVKIFIVASLKKEKECLNLANAIHNKNGCQTPLAAI